MSSLSSCGEGLKWGGRWVHLLYLHTQLLMESQCNVTPAFVIKLASYIWLFFFMKCKSLRAPWWCLKELRQKIECHSREHTPPPGPNSLSALKCTHIWILVPWTPKEQRGWWSHDPAEHHSHDSVEEMQNYSSLRISSQLQKTLSTSAVMVQPSLLTWDLRREFCSMCLDPLSPSDTLMLSLNLFISFICFAGNHTLLRY